MVYSLLSNIALFTIQLLLFITYPYFRCERPPCNPFIQPYFESLVTSSCVYYFTVRFLLSSLTSTVPISNIYLLLLLALFSVRFVLLFVVLSVKLVLLFVLLSVQFVDAPTGLGFVFLAPKLTLQPSKGLL